MKPIVRLILKPKSNTWGFYNNGRLVGTIYISLSKKEGTPNRVELMVDPEHNEKLVEPILNYAMTYVNENLIVRQNIIVEYRTSDKIQKAVYEKYGFTDVETMHLLGLKIK